MPADVQSLEGGANAPAAPDLDAVIDMTALLPGIIYVREGHIVRHLNPAGLRFVGLPHLTEQMDLLATLVHPEDRLSLERAYRRGLRRGGTSVRHLRLRDADGAWRWVHVQEKVVRRASRPPLVVGTLVEIDGLKRAALQTADTEERIRQAMDRQVLLLRELNHRIKNNLQLVASLLRLQASSLTDPAIQAVFDRACHRVTCIADIHAGLYMTEDVNSLDFGSYALTMAQRLPQLLSDRPPGALITMNAEPGLMLDVDRAVPLGLILHELLCNALQHGTPPGGRVQAGLARRAEHLCLWVADEGRGNPVSAGERLGMRLVRALVAQVSGCLDMVQQSGRRYEVRLPADFSQT